jgi:raffinose/stachyose/melibiose transport system permease protein
MVKRLRRGATGYWFVFPAFALYGLFVLYPFFNSILLSLTTWDGAQPIKKFVGLANYARMLDDPTVWETVGHNVVWIILGTIGTVAVALLMAVLVSSVRRFQTFFTTVFFVPVLLSSAVVGVIWSWMYDPTGGVIHSLLEGLGFGSIAPAWLGDPDVALYAILVASIWGSVGFIFIILLAGLRSVDQDLIDAAHVDGAGTWRRFRDVILPEIAHVLTTVTVLTLIAGFAVFDIPFVMTDGGPAGSTNLIALYAYHRAFKGNEVGYGSALSMVITALALATSVSYMWLRSRRA